MKRFRKAVAACLCLLVCFGVLTATVRPVLAADQNDIQATRDEYQRLKERKKEIDKEIASLTKSVESGRATAAQQEALRQANKEKIDLLQQQVDAKLLEIEQQQLLIDQKHQEIIDKQREYDDNYTLFTERLVAIYKMNNSSVLSTLLNVNTFSEMLTLTGNLQIISQHDTDMLDNLEAQRLALEAQRTEMEAMMAELEAARAQLDEDLKELQALNDSLNQQINATYAQIAYEEAEMEALLREQEENDAIMEEMWKSLAASTGEYFGGDLTWPVPGYNGDRYISSHFGPRVVYGGSNFHTGMDIARGDQASINGATIVAANTGKVIAVDAVGYTTYGYYLIIDHGGGVRTLYAHCSSISVSVGDDVLVGDPIAKVGNTGRSTGPHLHFELRINNTEKINPYPYLTGQKSL